MAVAALLSTAFGMFAQAPLTYHPERVTTGQTTTIAYKNQLTTLKDCTKISGVIYMWIDYQWIADDLELIKNDTAWVARYDVPAACALVCPVFSGDGIVDKGGFNTYVQFTMNPEGRNLPSAYVAWGMMRNPDMSRRYGIPGYCDSLNAKDNEVMRFWINNELRYNPSSQFDILPYALEAIRNVGYQPEKIAEIATRDVDAILALENPTERQLMNALEVARETLKDQEKVKQVEAALAKHFPDGRFVRDQEIWRLMLVKDNNEKIAEFRKFLQRFPPEKFRDVNSPNDKQYGDLFRVMVYSPIAANWDYSALTEYIHQVPGWLLPTFYWHLVQIPQTNGQFTADKLRPYADLIYGEMFSRPREGAERIYSPSQWNERQMRTRRDATLSYAQILSETGDRARALELAEQINPMYDFKSAEFNDFYVQLLATEGYKQLVIPTIERSVRENAATPEMLETLRKDYVAKNKSDKGYDAYLAGLKSAENAAKMREHLKESLVKEKIQLFSLENAAGGKVDMAQLKGKILVLDFWATWCAPCKAAMPGMQMAVDKYRDDKGVEFFFIATQETKPDFREQIAKFIKEKGYRMNVLYDNVGKNGQRDGVYSAYAQAFHFSGIPHKMIIDGEGYLRWHSTGYFGSPSALADEIGTLIELIKAEKK